MASNLFSTLFLAISCLSFLCSAQQSNNGVIQEQPSCVTKLVPCQASLVSRSKTPPATCCIPLKQIIQDDPMCLCNVFNDAAVLKALNITQQDGLNLAKYCQANADISVCKTEGGPSPSSPVTPASNNTTPQSDSAAVRLEHSFREPPAAISFVLFLLVSFVWLI